MDIVMKQYDAYTEYIVEQAKKLLSINSPSGYGREVMEYLMSELGRIGVKAERTRKGGILAEIPGQKENDALLLEAHCDTLGAMVHEIKSNGRLKMTNIGGMQPNNAEAENVTVVTKEGKTYEGTCQLANASVHVNGEYASTKRTWDTIEVVLDENVKSKEDTEALGIMAGDYVCFDPRTRVTETGYIKSRFLDDKLSAAILLGYAKYVMDSKEMPLRKVYMHFTIFEEVGHGGSSPCPADVTEAWSVDMGCVGEGLSCTEHEVSICAKDSGGPYSYDVVCRMIALAKKHNLGYAVDIYPHYCSDVEATLQAGNDVRHGLIGPGVYASHGYERSHKDGVKNTFELIKAYLGEE
ncbi:MAG: M42 family metallopeptidase [Eubacteriales bacterium]|nr:M42 family metallopeptidase [Eubacteriales bacterium]